MRRALRLLITPGLLTAGFAVVVVWAHRGAVGPEVGVALHELDAMRGDVRADLASDRLDDTG